MKLQICDSIMMSRADNICGKLAEVEGDACATWRSKLLHSKPPFYQNDAESTSLSVLHSQNKQNTRIWDSITTVLQSLSGSLLLLTRNFVSIELAVCSPVNYGDVTCCRKWNQYHVTPCQSYSLSHVLTFSFRSLYDLQTCRSQKVFSGEIQESTSDVSAEKVWSRQLIAIKPISNLSTISKVLERLVLIKLRPHLFSSSSFNEYQSCYRTSNLTETALPAVLNGVYTAANDKQLSVIIRLDLSAAFDTVQHDISK